MTISSSYAPDTYSGNGSLDTFAITFAFSSNSSNVQVSIKDTNGTITLKTAGNHYNISSTNVVFTGGNIPAATDTVIIELDPDFLQSSDYTENSNFPASTVEGDLDQLKLEVQYLKDLLLRAVKVDPTVDLDATSWVLPDAVASAILGFNAAGDGLDVITLAALGAIPDPVPVANGGSGSTTASGARTALGLAIGTDVQAYSADLADLVTNWVPASASTASSLDFYEDTDNGTNKATLIGPTSTADVTVTLPAATDTLVGKATTDVLTNKTLDYASNTISNLPYDIPFFAGFDATAVKEDVVVQSYAKMVMTRTGSILGESGDIETAPTGAALIVDIEKNGTTIYSTKPQFAATSTTLTAGTLKVDGTEDFVAGDVLTFKVTQVGSTEPGEGLTFTVKGEV